MTIPRPPGGDSTVLTAWLQRIWTAGTVRDDGWTTIDTSDTAGTIRDPANPGTLQLRRDGRRVTARLSGVGLTAGDGSGFIFLNDLPVGYRAHDIPGPAACGELGDTHSTANRNRVHATTDDLYWVGWSSHTGFFAKSRFTGRTLQGELSWITDDPAL